MTEAAFKPRVKLTALFEGVPIPILQAQMKFMVNQPAAISLSFPYIPQLDTISSEVKKTVDGGEIDGLTIVNDTDLYGVQPDTEIEIFAHDEYTDIDQFIVAGRLNGPVIQSHTGPQHIMHAQALGSMYFMHECYRYMVDRGTNLGYDQNDWQGLLGTLSFSELSTKLKTLGLSAGLMEILKDAGLNTTERLHILWKLQRLDRRISIVDNPKAMGYFQGSRLEKILEKTVNKMRGHAPVVQLFMQILRLLDYTMLNVAAPSFLEAEYAGDILDINAADLGNPYAVKVNDLVMMPDIGQLSPPPRANVIFPCDYGSWQSSKDFSAMPTRMIARVSGRGSLQGSSGNATTIILPTEVADGIREKEGSVSDKKKGRYYNSPQERYSGVIHHNSTLNRPEYIGDMESEYVKKYLELQFYKAQHNEMVSLTSNFLNFKPVIGFSGLALFRNGQHKVGRLAGVSYGYVANGTARTEYHFEGMRSYSRAVTSREGGAWLEHNFFAPENIGSYLYPKLIGRTYEHGLDFADRDPQSDMSILAHLYDSEEITPDELKAKKAAPTAIKDAVDKLYALYRGAENKYEFARIYGGRVPITKKQWLEGFMRCKMSDDGKVALGGYSIRTTAVSLEEGQDIEVGDQISDASKIAGSYIRERQEAYFRAYGFFLENWKIPVNVDYFIRELEARMLSDRQGIYEDLVEEAALRLQTVTGE